MPRLPASSSSRTIIGMKMSCSSKRKIDDGSCMSTLVSRTKMRCCADGFFFGGNVGLRSTATAARWSEFAGGVEDGRGVSRDLYLAPFTAQDAILVEQKCAALHTHEFPAVHALLTDHVEEPADLAIDIREQLERELVFRLELVMRRERVRRHPDNVRVRLAELRVQVAKFNAFAGAARRVVLGIEVHDQLATRRGRSLPRAPACGGQ